MNSKDHITMVGAGLAGPLMASYLSKHGYTVEIHEKRKDMRLFDQSAGRSINLALSRRGMDALRDVGVLDTISPMTLPMEGRMIHEVDGSTHLQKYGQKSNEVIYSISRAFLNKTLMDHAEATGNVNIVFDHPIQGVDLDRSEVIFEDNRITYDRLFGSDGSSSQIRDSMDKLSSINFRKDPLDHGYKELTIPPDDEGCYRMDPKALHIWPRGEFMLIALPNMDRSFTCTLFFPLNGEVSFSTMDSSDRIFEFFSTYFPDTIELIPDLMDEYQCNPIGKLATIYCDKWHYKDKVLLFGDAAHAVVPFFGQGMNASFQDCTVINELIVRFNGDWGEIFSEFSKIQVPNGHAIANMALENYIEMRDSVNDPLYKKRRELEFELEEKFSDRFIPRYSMVSFHDIPYSKVYERGLMQLNLVNEYLSGGISKETLHDRVLDEIPPLK